VSSSPAKFSKLFNWVAQTKELSAFEKLLYTRMQGHLGENDRVWPGMKLLAHELGASPSQVAKALKNLERRGLILVTRRWGADGKRLSSEYEFPEHPLMYVVYNRAGSPPTPMPPGGDPYSPGRCRATHSAGDTPIHPAGAEEIHPDKRLREEIQEETQTAGFGFASPQPDADVHLTDKRPHPQAQELLKPEWTDAALNDFMDRALDEASRTSGYGFNMSQDALERHARLASARTAAAKGAEKNKVTVEKREAKHDTKVWGQANPTVQQKLQHINNGKRIPNELTAPIEEIERVWQVEFKKKFPNDLIASAWERKERACAAALILQYNVVAAKNAVEYYIRYWDQHRPRFFKGNATLPTIGQLRAMHTQLVPEAKLMSHALEVRTRYHHWLSTDGKSGEPPPEELQTEYNKVTADLKSIGL